MEIKAGKIFTVWQDGVKIGESILEERKIPLFVEPETVRRGKWKERGIMRIGYECSECGIANLIMTNYCPNCGARMEVKE